MVFLKENIYRLNCESPLNDRRVYVCANNSKHAAEKAVQLLTIIYGCPAGEVSIYNLKSYRECVDEGLSELADWRLFESGWRGDEVVDWSLDGLILTDHETADFLRAVLGAVANSIKADVA